MSFDIKKLENLPQKPGVYLMKDEKAAVLYVGKAKNLKARVKQYFASRHEERVQVPYLMEQVAAIDTIIVSSEKEALLLENTLIKRYKPKYNILLKDDKSYISFKITTKHPWPMMNLVRYKGRVPTDAEYFGPFTNSQKARQMFDLIARLFPLRQCSDEEFNRRVRPCLLYQIKRCLAPCVNFCTKEEYQSNVRNAEKMLTGRHLDLIRELKKEMDLAADALEFEKAAILLKKIRLIESMKEVQQVEAISSDSLDVLASFRTGTEVVITKLVYRTSKLIDARHFVFENVAEDDSELMQSFLLQHYLKEDELIAREIILSHPVADLEVISEIISDRHEKKIEITVPQKGEKKKLVELAFVNAESAFHTKKDTQALKEKLLLDLQEKLALSHFPRRIECFDNSHLSGKEMVSSMVVFVDGEKYKAGYRKYHMRSAGSGDDYGMLKEVLIRRYGQKEKQKAGGKKQEELPDLIIIDGGKGHYHTACKALSELDIASTDVIAVAKEHGRHDKGLTQEVVFHPGSDEPIILERHSPLLHLLQNIRDEAHRFAITFHKTARKKQIIKSLLDDVAGIGPVKKRKLLQAFGSVKAIQESDVATICKVPGITKKDAEKILTYLK